MVGPPGAAGKNGGRGQAQARQAHSGRRFVRRVSGPSSGPAKESWWRRVLPGSGKKTPRTVDGVALAPAASAPAPMPTDRKDISGVWRGRWAANGSWGERRESDA